MPSLLVVALLVIVSLHGAFGAPSCSKANNCISKCKHKHGWPGYSMSTKPWETAVHKTGSSYTPEPSGVVSPPSNGNGTSAQPTSTPAPEKPKDTSSTPPAPTSTPAARVSSGSTSDGNVSAADISAYLSAHNTVRAQHGAAPLTWSNSLSAYAQSWADGCKFVHSGGPNGENLAAGTGDYTIADGVGDWAAEVSQYNAGNPVPSHFTQMVWKGTTQVGCAVQKCSGIFPSSYGLANYYVCEYSPPGNVIGEFAQNVQA